MRALIRSAPSAPPTCAGRPRARSWPASSARSCTTASPPAFLPTRWPSAVPAPRFAEKLDGQVDSHAVGPVLLRDPDQQLSLAAAEVEHPASGCKREQPEHLLEAASV